MNHKIKGIIFFRDHEKVFGDRKTLDQKKIIKIFTDQNCSI